MSRAAARLATWLTALLVGAPALAQPPELAQPIAAAVDAGIVDPALAAALARGEAVRVIVLLAASDQAPGAQAARVGAALAGPDLEVKRRFSHLRGFTARAGAAGIARLARDPEVRRIGLDLPVEIQLGESLPLAEITPLQGQGYTGAGRTLAIIDTGIDTNHADFAGRIVDQQCFCQGPDGAAGCCPNTFETQSGAGAAEDANGHGTNVAGVAAGGGAVAPAGAAPDAQIVMVRTFGPGSAGMSSDIILGLQWILANHPEVDAVNLSLGGGMFAGDCDDADTVTEAYATAVAGLAQAGVLTVAASGNDGWDDDMLSPACIRDVFSVGAVWDATLAPQNPFGFCTDDPVPDLVACWSSSSSTLDGVAPGGRITTSVIGGGQGTRIGTSFAAPHVVGCATDLRQAHPHASVGALRTALRTSQTWVTDTSSGRTHPRLDCAEALRFLTPGVPSLAPTGLGSLALALACCGGAWLVRRRR